MLRVFANLTTSAIRPNFAVCGFAFLFLTNISSVCADQIVPVLDTAAANSQSQTPMQTIDSQSADGDSQLENQQQLPQTIEPKPTETKEPSDNALEPKTPAAEPSPAINSDKKDLGEKTTHFITHLPQRLTFFSANVVVAAPALFVRRSAQYTASNTKELIGDHKNPILLVPAGTLSLYYGLTSGLVEGTVFGITNSWKYSADGKISKASLGLEDK